jgi:hypothetical protein
MNNFQAISSLTNVMVKVYYLVMMEALTMASGLMVRKMDLEFKLMLMEMYIQVRILFHLATLHECYLLLSICRTMG